MADSDTPPERDDSASIEHLRFRYTEASARTVDARIPTTRPYLWLHLRGPNGRSGPIRRIVDTGADNTILPRGYISLLGYDPETLRPCNIRQVEGSCDGHEALAPCIAKVVAVEDIEFELRPFFMDSDEVLWGRQDFLEVFDLIVEHGNETFDLIYDEGR